MRVPVAFVDANVLYSKTLRDWLFLLRRECSGAFLLFSSRDSITETMYHQRRNRPTADGEQLARIQANLYRSLDDVVDQFPGNISFPGLDPQDQHIHAAAISVEARYLITDDIGFADIDEDDLPYEVHSSDSFFMLVAENMPSAIDAVIIKQLTHYRQQEGVLPLDVKLEQSGCLTFAECVRVHTRQMAQSRNTGNIAKLLREQTCPDG